MPQPTTCPSPQHLAQLRQGRVPFSLVEELAKHLEQCEACVRTFQTLPQEDTLVEVLRAQAVPRQQAGVAIERLMERLRSLKDPAPTASVSDAATLPPLAQVIEEQYAFLTPPQGPDELGRLGAYRILDVLGAGGMGVVFRAADSRLKRQVALKVIKPEIVQRKDAHTRFLREAQAIAQLEHENIVTILHVDEVNGVPFLAMPLLRGESLDERLRRAGGPLPLEETLRIGREIASGLAAAHDRGLIHRDIKPSNVFLTSPSSLSTTPDTTFTSDEAGPKKAPAKAVILDFGLVRDAGSDEGALSQHGQIIGSPAYMAPEQGRGHAVDHRADLFSLGCVLYRMATGLAPFRAADTIALLLSIALEEPQQPSELNPELPPALTQLIEQLLAKNPEQRPASARAVVEAIQGIERQRAEAQRPHRSRAALWIGTAAALLMVVTVGSMLVWVMSQPAQTLPVPPSQPPKPGQVSFAIDEPGLKLAIRRGDADNDEAFEPKDGSKHDLPPGNYRIRTISKHGERRVVPDEFVVKSGEEQTLALRLVGEISKITFVSFVTGVAVSPRERDAVILGSTLDWNRSLVVWDGKSDVGAFPVLDEKLLRAMECVALAPDGIHAATGCGKNTNPRQELALYLWDIAKDKPDVLERKMPLKYPIQALAYLPDGKRLLSGDMGGAVLLWNLEEGNLPPIQLEGHQDVVASVACSADGKRGLSGGLDKLAIVWDLTTAKEIQRLAEHPDKVRSVAFGPGANQVTTACQDGVIRIWDLKEEQVRKLHGHKGSVYSIAVSPDGKRLLSGGEDGTIRLWNVETGLEVHPSPFRPGPEAVNSVAFAQDGRRAVSGGKDRTMRLWELPR
jgi:serine/threonine protein kinase